MNFEHIQYDQMKNNTVIQIINNHLNGFQFHPTQFISLIPNKYKYVKWKVNKRIGNNSAYGQVYSINIAAKNNTKVLNELYVVKFIKLYNRSDKVSFDREVAVGTTKGIEKVGPKIYMAIRTNEYGLYIMDNLLEGLRNVKMKLLYDYFNTFYKNVCPLVNSQIYKQLQITLRNFYKLGFYHGDLHFGNIAVIYTPKSKKLIVKIFDYGAAQVLASENWNLNNDCIESILIRIHDQFQRKALKSRQIITNNDHYKLIGKTNGQRFSSNTEALKNGLGLKRYKNFKDTSHL